MAERNIVRASAELALPARRIVLKSEANSSCSYASFFRPGHGTGTWRLTVHWRNVGSIVVGIVPRFTLLAVRCLHGIDDNWKVILGRHHTHPHCEAILL